MGKYPEPLAQRSGCKVGWLSYAKKKDAVKAAEIAKVNAAEMASRGYDFGFQSPGSIRKSAETGLWIVVIP